MSPPAMPVAAWDRPGLRERVVRTRRDGLQEAVLRVENLQSPHRVLGLEGRLDALPGLQRHDLDRPAQRLRVAWDGDRLGLGEILAACAAAGCTARPLARAALDNPRRREARAALRRLLVAGLCAMQAMMFAFVLYLAHHDFVDAPTRDLFRWLSLMAAAPVLLWAAQPFYRRAWEDLRAARVGTETLITLAVILVSAGSLAAMLRGRGEVYFESISMLVFVLLLGRWLELRERHRSGAQGEAAADAVPVAAERRRADGSLEPVAVEELQPGDRVHVAEGGVVPADGRVLGTTRPWLDESLLTGESTPRECADGEAVAAGSVVVHGPLEMRVERPAGDSALATLEALARRAADSRLSREGDAMAARFALRVLVFAGLTAALWLWLDPGRALEAVVAVIVVACPCAFALAAPVVASRAMAALGRREVWVGDADRLFRLARIDLAIFDKTGTLTEPQLEAEGVRCPRGDAPEAMLDLAAALARESSHPLARLVAAATARPLPAAEEVEVRAGDGIRGRVAGRELRLGRAGFAPPGDPGAAADGALVLADDAGILAVFPVAERLRPEAREAVTALAAEGIEVEVASGDVPARVEAAARALGASAWHARQTPADKLALVQARRAAGATVLAVGDGANDAPSLAAADVSAAVAPGTELARAHADILLAGGLDGLLPARRVARAGVRVLAQNRRWALVYNLAAAPFAAAGLVSPWLAALGMSLSSVAVVLNALRVRSPQAGRPSGRDARLAAARAP